MGAECTDHGLHSFTTNRISLKASKAVYAHRYLSKSVVCTWLVTEYGGDGWKVRRAYFVPEKVGGADEKGF